MVGAEVLCTESRTTRKKPKQFAKEHPAQPATFTEHLPVTQPRPQPRRPLLAPPPGAHWLSPVAGPAVSHLLGQTGPGRGAEVRARRPPRTAFQEREVGGVGGGFPEEGAAMAAARRQRRLRRSARPALNERG